MKLRMNDQTRIIVATAVALTIVDLGIRSVFLNRAPAASLAGGVVTAREIRLVDDQGNLRAHLYTDENSEPGMVMYDRANVQRLQLDTWENIPSLILNRPDGARSTYYGMDDNGMALFNMYGNAGEPRVSMDANSSNLFANGSTTLSNVTLNSDTISVRAADSTADAEPVYYSSIRTK